MSEQYNSTNTVEERQKLISLWTAGVFTVLGLIFFVYSIYVVVAEQQGRFDLSDKILMPITALMFIVSIISFGLIRRGRLAPGAGLLFFMIILVPPVVAVLLLKSLVTISIVYIILLASFMIGFVLPKTMRRLAVMASLITILLNIGIEFWDPKFRTDTGIGSFSTTVIVLAVLGLLAFFIRQAWIGNLRSKLSTSFVVITIVSGLMIAIPAQRSLSTSLTNIIGNNLSENSNARAIEIAVALDREKDTLEVLSLNKAVQDAALEAASAVPLSPADITRLDEQWRAADATDNNANLLVAGVINNAIASELRSFRGQFPQHVEVFLTNTQGLSIASTNRTSDYLQADEEWWQVAYQDGAFIGQPEYDESSKTIAIIMAVAVRENGDGRVLGVLRTTVNFATLTDTLAYGLFGQTGRTNIYLPDGRELKLNFKGDNTVELVEAAAPPEIAAITQSALKYQVISLNGIPVIASTAVVRTLGDTTEDTALISELGWRVVTLQDQAEAQQPVNDQTRNITILAIVIITVVAFAGNVLANVISGPIIRLNAIAEKVATGDLNVEAKVETRDEIGILATTFNSMIARLREFIGTLESRVAERTQSLELAAEVGRSVSQVRALDVMLKDAAELIRSRFDLYYVQVYLTDSRQTNLILQSGTGTVGAELLGRGHRLPMDTASINGQAAVEKRSVVISDTSARETSFNLYMFSHSSKHGQKAIVDTAASPTFRPNPLLPDTRSEMAVPLMVGEKVVGVLDLQNNKAGSLNQDTLPGFEALAAQLAIAIQNANLLAETNQARAEVESQARRLSRANWVDYLDAIHQPEEIGFVFEQNKITPMTQEEPIKENALTASIAVTGEALGNLVVEMEGGAPIVRTDELVNAVARQVSQQIESLRLLESAERYRFEAEQASRRITREGWKDYTDANTAKGLSFIYDLKEVRPFNQAGYQQAEESAFSLPLKVRDETIGRLVVQGLGADDTQSLELANAVAERLGAHIESLRQFDETKRGQVELDKRAHQLEAVAEISTVSSKELDIDKMLHSVVHLTQRQFGLYHVHVFIHNENTAELKIAACGWKEGDIHEGTDGIAVIPMDQELSLVARAARTRQVVTVNDVHNEPGWLPNPLLPDTASEMAVPLIIGDQVLGVMDVQSDRLNAFSEEDANIQTTLAAQVSTALQNARSFAKSQQQADRESTLNLISQKIQSATTVEAVLQIAARELGHALGAPMTIAQLSMKDKK